MYINIYLYIYILSYNSIPPKHRRKNIHLAPTYHGSTATPKSAREEVKRECERPEEITTQKTNTDVIVSSIGRSLSNKQLEIYFRKKKFYHLEVNYSFSISYFITAVL